MLDRDFFHRSQEGVPMRSKLWLSLAAVTLLAFGLFASSRMTVLSSVEAQQPPETLQPVPLPPVPDEPARLQPSPVAVPPPLAPPHVIEPPLPIPQPEPVLVRFTTSVTPVFEGGAVGMPLPVTIEIRGDDRLAKIIRLAARRKKLPDKVKEAIQAALEEAATDDSPEDPRLDEILERLQSMEKRLKRIEEQKASSKSP
jgi:hypothetical protein